MINRKTSCRSTATVCQIDYSRRLFWGSGDSWFKRKVIMRDVFETLLRFFVSYKITKGFKYMEATMLISYQLHNPSGLLAVEVLDLRRLTTSTPIAAKIKPNNDKLNSYLLHYIQTFTVKKSVS